MNTNYRRPIEAKQKLAVTLMYSWRKNVPRSSLKKKSFLSVVLSGECADVLPCRDQCCWLIYRLGERGGRLVAQLPIPLSLKSFLLLSQVSRPLLRSPGPIFVESSDWLCFIPRGWVSIWGIKLNRNSFFCASGSGDFGGLGGKISSNFPCTPGC